MVNFELAQIDVPARLTARSIQPLLKLQKQMTEAEVAKEIHQLPYHYVESAQGYMVAGWKFPKRWKFELLCFARCVVCTARLATY